MAEFLEDSAGVFRGIDACLFDPGLNAECGVRNAECIRNVVIGCDVAKHTDWTVVIAMDVASGRCLAMERFNQLDWPIQKERIVAFARRWRGRVILDATGIGDPIYDDLKRVLPDIEPFKLTTGSKTELVQRLVVAVEQRQVSWPGGASVQCSVFGVQGRDITAKDTKGREGGDVSRGGAEAQRGSSDRIDRIDGIRGWEILTAEMKRFEYQISPGGNISYGAPSGYHDDCVMALALANHGRWAVGNCGNMLRVCDPYRGGEGRFRRRERVLLGV
jgi:hypothetical protein